MPISTGTSAPEQAAELSGYLPSLDGWRAVAISIVMFFHSSDSLILAFGKRAGLVGAHRGLGTFGVDIFFAISGLLITSRLLVEEDRMGSISLKSFYLRRAFRILPPSLTFLAAVGMLGGLGVIAFNLRDWLGAVLFYVNFLWRPLWYVGHFWSLAVEEHYYAVWPAVLFFVKGRRRLTIAIVFTMLVAAWRAFNISSVGVAFGSSYYGYETRTDFQVDIILWGAATALFYRKYSQRRLANKVLSPYLGLVLASLVLLSLGADPNWKIAQLLQLMRSVFIPVILLVTILNVRCLATTILERPWLRWVGKLSFSLYLWQQLFLVWGVQKFAHISLFQRFPYNIGCAFVCAFCSYYLIEKPCIRMGHKIAERIEVKIVIPEETVLA